MRRIGIFDIDAPEKAYFLLESIRKNCQHDGKILFFNMNEVNPVLNHIDDVEKIEVKGHQGLPREEKVALCEKTFKEMFPQDETFLVESGNLVKKRSDVWNDEDCLVRHDDSPWVYWLRKNQEHWKREYYDVIISMTSWKGRIGNDATLRVIRSLFNQKTSYRYKIVLVLSEEEFRNKEIPSAIRALESEIFEILWTYKDTRPLKKLDPTMEKYPDVPIVTLDDDDYCLEDMVEFIVNEHRCSPWHVLGTMFENSISFCNWVAGVRLFPPHCLYPFPLEDYYKYYDGILDDNFNAMRCMYKMTPVKGISDKYTSKKNDNDLKLTNEYSKTDWNKYYRRFIMDHLDILPEELYYE